MSQYSSFQDESKLLLEFLRIVEATLRNALGKARVMMDEIRDDVYDDGTLQSAIVKSIVNKVLISECVIRGIDHSTYAPLGITFELESRYIRIRRMRHHRLPNPSRSLLVRKYFNQILQFSLFETVEERLAREQNINRKSGLNLIVCWQAENFELTSLMLACPIPTETGSDQMYAWSGNIFTGMDENPGSFAIEEDYDLDIREIGFDDIDEELEG